MNWLNNCNDPADKEKSGFIHSACPYKALVEYITKHSVRVDLQTGRIS